MEYLCFMNIDKYKFDLEMHVFKLIKISLEEM